MNTFRNLRIGLRLGLAFAFVLVLLLAVVSVGLLRLSELRDQLNLIVENRYPKVLLASDIKNDVNIVVRNARAMLIDNDEGSLRKAAADSAAARARIGEAMDKLDRTLQAPETRKIFAELRERRALFVGDQMNSRPCSPQATRTQRSSSRWARCARTSTTTSSPSTR